MFENGCYTNKIEHGRVRNLAARTIEAVKLVARDGRIPKPLRGLMLLGLLPIPGPFDELVLLLVALPLFVFYRDALKDAWQRTRNAPPR